MSHLAPSNVPGNGESSKETISLLVESFTIEDRMYVISNIVPLVDTIYNHAFGNRDHLGRDLVQNTDYSSFVTIVCTWVDDKRVQFIGQFFFIGKGLEQVGHGWSLSEQCWEKTRSFSKNHCMILHY
jgi:hypothetical protein